MNQEVGGGAANQLKQSDKQRQSKTMTKVHHNGTTMHAHSEHLLTRSPS